MASLRRMLASRSNGRRSEGPKTREGKERSSQNGLRHGLLAKCVVLSNESREGFDELLCQYVERFGAGDDVELGMVEEMVAAFWRQRRAWAIETRLLENALAGQPAGDEVGRITAAFSALAESRQLALIHRYETRLHRMFQRALFNVFLLRGMVEPGGTVTSGPALESGESAVGELSGAAGEAGEREVEG